MVLKPGRKTWDECVKNDLAELGLHQFGLSIELGGGALLTDVKRR